MTEPTPPPRPAMLDGHMEYGQPREDAIASMFVAVCSLVRYRDRWLSPSVSVLLGAFTETAKDKASVDFAWRSATLSGSGRIVIEIDRDGWTRADVFIDGRFLTRAWFEQVWEEIEFWPDGSDGVPAEIPGFIGAEPTGRIGKHRT